MHLGGIRAKVIPGRAPRRHGLLSFTGAPLDREPDTFIFFSDKADSEQPSTGMRDVIETRVP